MRTNSLIQCRQCKLGIVEALIIALMVCFAYPVRADFTSAGGTGQVVNFNNTTDFGGGVIGGELIVGTDDLGGLLGDGEQVLGGVIPLGYDDVTIGRDLDGIGAITLNDSASRIDITNDLTIGNEGQGLVAIGTSATVDVAGNTVLGAIDSGYGILEINGTVFPGARLRTVELTVGDAGTGVVEISDRGSLVSEVSMIGATLDSGDGMVSLTDSGTRWSVRGSLEIGGLAGLSHGKVQIANNAMLQISPDPADTSPTAAGTLTVNERGSIDLAGGTLRMRPQVANPIINNGIIRGDGFIDGGMTIGATGQLRNANAQVQNANTVVNQREYLLVAEEVTNDGLIESIGGEMEFEQLVTNNNVIVANDALMRFRATEAGTSATFDLIHNGDLILLGQSIIYGDIDASGGGTITTNANPIDDSVTINGDVTFDPTPSAALAPGAVAASTAPAGGFALTVGETASLIINGDLNLGNVASLAIDYVGETSVEEGDLFSAISVAGEITGDFAESIFVAEGRYWDIMLEDDEVQVVAGALFVEGDFDFDGDVDGADFLAWQRGPADSDGLALLTSNFGGSSAPTALSAATSAVPEPSTFALAMLTLVCCSYRRAACAR